MTQQPSHLLPEMTTAYEQLRSLCEAAEIPPFDAVQYDVELRLAQFVWDDSEFGLFILLEDYDLDGMSPARLRDMWEEDATRAEEALALASEAVLN